MGRMGAVWFLLLLAMSIAGMLHPVQGQDQTPGGNPTLLNGSKDTKLAMAARGTVKTIQGGGGDVIDCVDIYKQPAFEHPLLKNHTLQMKPSFRKEDDGDFQGLPVELKGWGVDCPKGTVPIIRKTLQDGPNVKKYFPMFPTDRKSLNKESFHVNQDGEIAIHEYAAVLAYPRDSEGTYHGGRAKHNVWNPHIGEPGAFSLSQIWITGGPEENLETIEAGWIAGLELDNATRFFTYWTRDKYRTTGCYNTRCPGFVATNSGFAPGFILPSVSQYGGEQIECEIKVEQDPATGNWWLQLNGKDIGYWPANIFNALRAGARGIDWGGEIAYYPTSNLHTRTQMGSGIFPGDGFYTKSAYVSNLAWEHSNYGQMTTVPSEALKAIVTNNRCYDLAMGPNGTTFETHFYFEGPGYSEQCQYVNK